MVRSSEGTYLVLSVCVEFVCIQHEDDDGDFICDYCNEFSLTEFTISDYNKDVTSAIVFAPSDGRYSLVFADYENGILKNVDIVEYDFKKVKMLFNNKIKIGTLYRAIK